MLLNISTFYCDENAVIGQSFEALTNKWNKAFRAEGYYVATIGNLTKEAIKKYIAEQSEESGKEDNEGAAFLAVANKRACDIRLSGVQVSKAPWDALEFFSYASFVVLHFKI